MNKIKKGIARTFLILNLRMFDANTQTTTLNNPGNDLSPEMKTYYEKRLIDLAEPKLVHDQFGDKYPIPKNGGKTIEFRKYSPLQKATTPITEGVTPNGNKLNVSAMTATIDQYGDYVQLSDLLDLTAIDNNVVQATKLLGSQSGRTLDTVTREVLAGGTSVMFAPKADGTVITSRLTLDATCKINVDLIFRAKAQLAAMNANPIDDSFVAIIHPYVSYDLMRDPEWIDVHKYATPDNIYQGEIGKIGGVRFVETSEAKIWKDETCPAGLAVFSTLVLASNAFGVTEVQGGGLQHIVKQLGYGNDPLNQRSSAGWKATKVAKRLVEEYMVRIESCSAYSAAATAN
jgi:N4-gp56 family major capsid protein